MRGRLRKRGWPGSKWNGAHEQIAMQVPYIEATLNMQLCMQESNLFFTAVDKVSVYAKKTGHLPTIISENVQGRRYRHRDVRTVCSTLHSFVML
jgi:broad-specificity NMP kinase